MRRCVKYFAKNLYARLFVQHIKCTHSCLFEDSNKPNLFRKISQTGRGRKKKSVNRRKVRRQLASSIINPRIRKNSIPRHHQNQQLRSKRRTTEMNDEVRPKKNKPKADILCVNTIAFLVEIH